MNGCIERISGEITDILLREGIDHMSRPWPSSRPHADIGATRIHAGTSIAMLQRKFGQVADPAGRAMALSLAGTDFPDFRDRPKTMS